MKTCGDCNGEGYLSEEGPRYNCYRPGDQCKWVSEEICEPTDGSDTFRCICEDRIIVCRRCRGRGVVLGPLEELAECAE